MNFRKRLIIAFFIMALLPMLLLASLGVVILKYQTMVVKETYEVEVNGLQMFQNPIHLLNRLTGGIYSELQTVCTETPDKMLNAEYLKDTDSRLKRRQAFLVVRQGERLAYCGNYSVYAGLKDRLPAPVANSVIQDGGIYIGGRNSCLVKQQGVTFSDGTAGTVLVISDVSTILPQLKDSLIQAVCACLIVLLTTASLVTLWLYSGVVRPINQLKQATNRVKDGDLNFHLEKTGEDEIGELSADFEEMREHLKNEIDARVKYEEDLRNLIGNISHDLKTPLTILKGYAEGLLDGVAATPERQEKYLRIIRSKSEDMTGMIEELSLYARIESKAYPYYFERVSLVKFFTELAEEEAAILEEKNITLRFRNEALDAAEVYADREQLKRVMRNIIGNSVKYLGKDKGNFLLVLRETGEQVEIEFTDDGAGIAERDLPHIFERFYRSDASRNSGTGGSGLGLSIVKQIIEDHGGTIWASSVFGEGTSIYFTLSKADCRIDGKGKDDGENTDH